MNAEDLTRCQVVEVDPQMLTALLMRGATFRVGANGLPEDARLTGAWYDEMRRIWRLRFWSATYEPTLSGMEYIIMPPITVQHVTAALVEAP